MKNFSKPILVIPQEVFQDDRFRDAVEKNLHLPARQFPHQFLIQDRTFLCGGYYAAYDASFSTSKLVEICKKRNWEQLVSIDVEFFVIYFDFTSKTIFVFTDPYGKFPCFFSTMEGKLVISFDFIDVVVHLSSPKANMPMLFERMVGDQLVLEDQTIISGIFQIPPATLLTINSDITWGLSPQIDIQSFFEKKVTLYSNLDEFTRDFLIFFQEVVVQRLRAFQDVPYSADLSSGFDSSLVCFALKQVAATSFPCYALTSRYTRETDPPRMIRKFAEKHQLSVSFINTDEYYPFASQHDKFLTQRYIGDALQESFYRFLIQKQRAGAVACFEGFGGDEIYSSFQLELANRFSIQQEYFSTIDWSAGTGLRALVTEKSFDLLIDQKRFRDKAMYPLLLSHSVIRRHLEDFHLYWETGLWPITPFADIRLVQFARTIPHRGFRGPTREEVWRKRLDIFTPDQFRAKKPPLNFVKLLIDRNRKFLVDLLKESRLGQYGWVRSSELVNALQKENEQKYLSLPQGLFYIDNLVHLEYFLQKNNIQIPL